MAANARILYNYDTWDAATVSSSSQLSNDAPDDNVLLDPLGKKWATDSGDISSQWIKFDLGSATKITCICLAGGNWTSGATLTLQAHASDSWGAPSYSQALTIATDSDSVPWKHLVFFLDQTYRWWRLTWTDGSNPDNRLKLARVLAGEFYELTRNFARRTRITWSDPTDVEHKPGTLETAVRDEDILSLFRQIRAPFPARGPAAWAQWQAIYRKIGRVRPLVLALDPDNAPTEKSIYGYLITDMEATWERYERFDVATLVFEEKTH